MSSEIFQQCRGDQLKTCRSAIALRPHTDQNCIKALYYQEYDVIKEKCATSFYTHLNDNLKIFRLNATAFLISDPQVDTSKKMGLIVSTTPYYLR